MARILSPTFFKKGDEESDDKFELMQSYMGLIMEEREMPKTISATMPETFT